MPGTVMHLALANLVYEGLNDKSIDKTEFLSGNILPDEAENKEKSHYRTNGSVGTYRVPHMERVKEKLLDFNSSIKLGAYCHLYFDYHFFEDFFFKIFTFENGFVINKRTNKRWKSEDFWSREVFYSAYGQLNHLFINEGLITVEEIEKIPSILPKAHMSELDCRRKALWKEELWDFLNNPIPYDGNILEYGKTLEALKRIASNLIKHLKDNR